MLRAGQFSVFGESTADASKGGPKFVIDLRTDLRRVACNSSSAFSLVLGASVGQGKSKTKHKVRRRPGGETAVTRR